MRIDYMKTDSYSEFVRSNYELDKILCKILKKEHPEKEFKFYDSYYNHNSFQINLLTVRFSGDGDNFHTVFKCYEKDSEIYISKPI